MSADDFTVREFANVDVLVRILLDREVRCRNDDKWLTYRVFEEIAKKHGKKIFIPFELFEVFPAFETVKRCRAKIQNNEGKYLPTDPAVAERRQKREKSVRAIMGGQK